ncbi:MAG: acetate kinase [Limnochordia bacterium]|nr:acetate kinase [Limnochordia bacterium]
MCVLVINSGSSSLKYKLYDMKNNNILATGLVERIGCNGSSNYVFTHDGHGKLNLEQSIDNHKEALRLVLDTLQDASYGAIDSLSDIYAVGHRVLHGKESYADSVVVTEQVIDTLKGFIELGPLHMPANIMGIEACKELMPDVVQVAVFDTAFHQTIPEKAFLYAIPYELYQEHGIRKYGFHGTSHRYLSHKVAELLKQPLEQLRIITLHLGNGCSMAAVKNGVCIDTTMGLTPLEGLIMGTRSGDLDPAVIRFLAEKLDMSIIEIDDMLNKQSGLLGISGISSDMRDIHSAVDADDKRAKLAYEVFIYRIRKYLGAFWVAMGGVDAIVFAGGIGENDKLVRRDVCSDLKWLGLEIDDEKNNGCNRKEKSISKDSSKVRVMVIPTDEELVIAQDALRLAKREYAVR